MRAEGAGGQASAGGDGGLGGVECLPVGALVEHERHAALGAVVKCSREPGLGDVGVDAGAAAWEKAMAPGGGGRFGGYGGGGGGATEQGGVMRGKRQSGRKLSGGAPLPVVG